MAAGAVVQDDPGRILLQRRTDNGLWALPGWGMGRRQEFSVCIACRLIGGNLTVPDESHEVAWFLPEAIARLDMHPPGSGSGSMISPR